MAFELEMWKDKLVKWHEKKAHAWVEQPLWFKIMAGIFLTIVSLGTFLIANYHAHKKYGKSNEAVEKKKALFGKEDKEEEESEVDYGPHNNDNNAELPAIEDKEKEKEKEAFSNEEAAYDMSIALGFKNICLPPGDNAKQALNDYRMQISMKGALDGINEDVFKNVRHQFVEQKKLLKNINDLNSVDWNEIDVNLSDDSKDMLNVLSSDKNLTSYQINVLRMFVLGVMNNSIEDVHFVWDPTEGKKKVGNIELTGLTEIMPEDNVNVDRNIGVPAPLVGVMALSCVLLSLPQGNQPFTRQVLNFAAENLTEEKIKVFHEENRDKYNFTEQQIDAQLKRMGNLNARCVGVLADAKDGEALHFTPQELFKTYHAQHPSYNEVCSSFTSAFMIHQVTSIVHEGMADKDAKKKGANLQARAFKENRIREAGKKPGFFNRLPKADPNDPHAIAGAILKTFELQERMYLACPDMHDFLGLPQ